MTQITIWGPPKRTGAFCEPCAPLPGSAILSPEVRAAAAKNLDAAVTDLLTTMPPPDPPKPFDLEDLKRLAADVERLRPKQDRMVVAPDIRDWLLAQCAHDREVPGPDRLWGLPVRVDETMPPGSWELRDGDEVVHRERAAP